jgi:hypothetical protein
MKQDEYNENDLKRMEDELRSFGVPYSSNEPDNRYWANFRVRLNKTIDAKEAARSRSIVATIAEWFTASAFRGVAIGTAAIVVAIASVMMFNSNNAPVVATNNSVAPSPANTVSPQVSIQSVPATGSTLTAVVSQPKHLHNIAKAEVKKALATMSDEENIAEAASDPSSYDRTLSPGKADEPVDYSTLSEAELQSVLADISTISN